MVKLFNKQASEILVKICGVTNYEDIIKCAELGVSAVGFLIGEKKSSDSMILELEEAKKLIHESPPNIAKVLLIHESDFDAIYKLVYALRPTSLQIQRKKISDSPSPARFEYASPETLRKIKHEFPETEIIKTLFISDEVNFDSLLELVTEFSPVADAFLLDSAKGGSGGTHDWSISRKIRDYIKETSGKAVLLAEGLMASNIESAISRVFPDAVDIMSSVKIAGGRKNYESIQKLVEVCSGSSTAVKGSNFTAIGATIYSPFLKSFIKENLLTLEELRKNWGMVEDVFYPRLDRWIWNFHAEDRNTAMEIFLRIDYFSENRIEECLKAHYQRLQAILFSEKMDKDAIVIVSPSQRADSADHFSYLIRQAWKLPQNQFKAIDELESNRDQVLVFVNDTHGSGKQFIEQFKEKLSRVEYRKLVIVAITIAKMAQERFCQEFPTAVLIPDEPTRDVTELVGSHINPFIEKYGKLVYNLHPLGYGRTKLLTAYHYQCPNNSLPILWADGSNNKTSSELSGYPWEPLFPYKPKPKPVKFLEDTCKNKESNMKSNDVSFYRQKYKRVCITDSTGYALLMLKVAKFLNLQAIMERRFDESQTYSSIKDIVIHNKIDLIQGPPRNDDDVLTHRDILTSPGQDLFPWKSFWESEKLSCPDGRRALARDNSVLIVPAKLFSDRYSRENEIEQTFGWLHFDLILNKILPQKKRLLLGQHFDKKNEVECYDILGECIKRSIGVPGFPLDGDVFGVRGVPLHLWKEMYQGLSYAIGIAGTHTWQLLTMFPDVPQIILSSCSINTREFEDFAFIAKSIPNVRVFSFSREKIDIDAGIIAESIDSALLEICR